MDYKDISLADAVEFVVDNRGKTVPIQDDGIPLIATNCINNINLYPEFNNVRYVSDDIFRNWFRAHPLPDDIILTNKGSQNGAICLVPNPVSFCIAQDMVALRAKKNKVYPHYLFAVLRSKLVQDRIKNLNVDSVIPNFKKTDFDKLLLPLPEYKKQKYIGDNYFSFCQKIELNKQTNQTLDQMAKTLFKSWFVDFDPVFDNLLAKVDFKLENLASDFPEPLLKRAKMRLLALDEKSKNRLKSGIQSAHSQTTLLELTKFNIQKHFPSEFEQNEQLGWIPKGWEVQKISEFSDILNGYAFKSGDYVENGNFVLRTKNFKGNEVKKANDDVYLSDDFLSSHEKYLSKPFDYHLVMVGASVGKCAIIYQHHLPALRNQNMWCFRAKGKSGVKQPFIKYMLDSVVVKSLGLASGSAREFFRKGDFGNQLVCIGTNEVQHFFNEFCGQYLIKMSENSAQIETLTKLRDVLLPKLISEELQIPDFKYTDEKTA